MQVISKFLRLFQSLKRRFQKTSIPVLISGTTEELERKSIYHLLPLLSIWLMSSFSYPLLASEINHSIRSEHFIDIDDSKTITECAHTPVQLSTSDGSCKDYPQNHGLFKWDRSFHGTSYIYVKVEGSACCGEILVNPKNATSCYYDLRVTGPRGPNLEIKEIGLVDFCNDIADLPKCDASTKDVAIAYCDNGEIGHRITFIGLKNHSDDYSYWYYKVENKVSGCHIGDISHLTMALLDEAACCEEVTVDCPKNMVLEPCQTQDEVDAQFDQWLADFTSTGGSNPVVLIYDIASGNEPSAPSACGGEVTVKISAYDGNCIEMGDECQATFTVKPAYELQVICPKPELVDACSETAVDKFNIWLGGFEILGGCQPNAKFEYRFTSTSEWIEIAKENIPTVTKCDGHLEIRFSAKDDCDQFSTCESSFTIDGATELSIHCPKNEDLSACDENSLNVYQTWLDGFGFQGGCNTEVKYDYRLTPDGDWITIQSLDDLPEPELCGFFIEVCLAAKDDCDMADKCKSSFTIGGGQSLSIHCPKNEDLSACDENSLNVYQTWLDGFGFQGGCNTEVKYDYRLTPDGDWITIQSLDDLPEPELCGFFIEVCLAAKDDCDVTDKCKSSFTIGGGQSLSIHCPKSEDLSACDENSLNDYQAWLDAFGVQGGCNTEVKYDYRLTPDGEWITIQSLDDLPEPELCGFFIEVCLAAKDDCDVADKCKSSFTIGGGQSLSIHCPKNEDLSACDENSLDDYQAWLDEFGVQGGCNQKYRSKI